VSEPPAMMTWSAWPNDQRAATEVPRNSGHPPVIRRERYRFSYGRKWHLARMRAAKIRLPSKNGQPDWERMTSFVASLPFASGALDAGEAHVERGGLA